MSRSAKSHAALTRSVALFAVLAITTGWSAPARPSITSIGTSAPAAAASRDVAAIAARVAAWESGWDTRSASANLANAAGNDAFVDPTRSPRRAWVQHSGPPPAPAPAPAPAPKPKAPEPAKVTAKAQAPTYQGRNHFWIPSLGMSYNVHWYGCSDSFYPKNYIYRWGCAGKNNVYILGHAHSVMKPLHDLYVSGRLRKGMVAVYADAKGRVTKYKVTEWRVVRPTEIAWQIAAQPVPSMTLQTCVGKDSQYRLNVRLVAVR